MENINIKKKEEEEEEKNCVSFVSPGEIVGGGGDLLCVMDAARRNVSVLLINHRVGRTCVHTHTDTLEKGGGKKMKVERMNYRASRWRMMAV